MQQVRFKHGQVQVNELRYCEEQLGSHRKPVPQNSEDIISAMFSPVSFLYDDGELAEQVEEPPRVLEEPLPPPESANFNAHSYLQQLLDEPSFSSEQNPTSSDTKKSPRHMHPSGLFPFTELPKALASKRAHQESRLALKSKPLRPQERSAKVEHFGAEHSSSTKPTGKRTPRVRRYKVPVPSKFCHVCARSGDAVRLLACKNVKYGVCRKSVCQKCFEDHGWELMAAEDKSDEFSCCHCRRNCPQTAQCRTYEKTNERRRNNCRRKRMMIEDTLANGGDVEAVLRKSGLL